MFLGREKELEALERMYHKKGFQMTIVYGRRRIGKTALLNEFIREKNALYLPAEEVNDSLNLQKFSKLVGEKLGIRGFPTVDDWNNFFSIIKEQFGDERLVLVIDEYPTPYQRISPSTLFCNMSSIMILKRQIFS